MAIEVEKVVDRSRRICRGGGRRMRRTSQKWYNMQQIDMSNGKPMGIAADAPRARYSAAYPTGAERGLRRGNYCVTLTVSEGSDPKNTLYLLGAA